MSRRGAAAATHISWSELQGAIAANAQRSVGLCAVGGATYTVAALPAATTLSWLDGGWTEDTTFTVSDAVSLVLWIQDPLYRAAVASVRRAMEMEVAQSLLHGSEAAWHAHGGKARGWCRKHLEEDLRHRAGGGDPEPDAWNSVREKKRAAQLVDYICVTHGIRLALWWPEAGTCTMIPVAGGVAIDAPVVQLNCTTGRILIGPDASFKLAPAAWPALILKARDITWSPAACGPSAGSATVADIQSRIAAVDAAADRTGNRAVLWNRLQWLTLVRALNGGCGTNLPLSA
jgi:hypothetical protein